MPNFNPDLNFLDPLSGAHATDNRYVLDIEVRGDSKWHHNDSPFECYSAPYFPGVAGGLDKAIARYDIKNGVGMDIAGGSNGVALRDLMELGVLEKGLVTNLEDLRTPEVKADTRLDHLSGNILQPGTWQRMLGWVNDNAPDGLDLVMHRPVGALQWLPPETHRRAAAIVVDLLAPGGVFFTQVPHTMIELKDETRDYFHELPDVETVHISKASPHAIVVKAA